MKLYQVLVASLAVCGLVFAQEAATTTAPAVEKSAPVKAAKKDGIKVVIGTIAAVDAIANSVIIKTKKAEDTLSVNEKTIILVGGKTVALADLKADTKVTAHYKTEEGKMVAIKISEKTAAVKAAKSEAPATTTPPATK